MKCHDRFNQFVTEVSIINANISWILDKIDADDPGHHMLRNLVDQMEFLLDSQDCRDDVPELQSVG